MERIIRAAGREGAAVQVDLRSLIVTVIPDVHKPDMVDGDKPNPGILLPGALAPDGKENF
jgi:hypothetical protein